MHKQEFIALWIISWQADGKLGVQGHCSNDTIDLVIADGKEVHKVDVAASPSAKEASAKPGDTLARKQARAVKPGSFMHLLMSSHHTTDGSPFTDTEIIAQAFIFLLAGPLFLHMHAVP